MNKPTYKHMKWFLSIAYSLLMAVPNIWAQHDFDYELELVPVNITNLGGLHSYAWGQADGKWLIIGGRTDGLHPRQPFASFPDTDNNTNIYVVDVNAQAFWSAPLSSLPTGLQEQLQATNLSFYQDADTLYLIGGYAYSATAADHITFSNLSSVLVSEVIDAVVNGTNISPYFKQITDTAFAITGGQLGKIDDTYYLVGGHKFDGQYNPMGHATYTQSYSNQIRKFKLDNSGSQLSFSNYSTVTDVVHLHRRDYNLLPQVFPDGTEGYTISSGVFQINVDLPFLYPVDITATGYTPNTSFNQYLSNYHCATVSLYDSSSNTMHSLFFGGMSQYYYQNDSLIQDNQVPFVKTISRLTRAADGSLQEFQLPVEMPGLNGSSAEFIPNADLPHYESEIIKLSDINQDTFTIGYIYGGIYSSSLNPFSANLTSQTSADNTIYAVRLIKGTGTGVYEIDGSNPYGFELYPNPAEDHINLKLDRHGAQMVNYYITNTSGQIVQRGMLPQGNKHSLQLDADLAPQLLFITLIFDHKYYATQKFTTK